MSSMMASSLDRTPRETPSSDESDDNGCELDDIVIQDGIFYDLGLPKYSQLLCIIVLIIDFSEMCFGQVVESALISVQVLKGEVECSSADE
jgi:hypothetical protein